MSDFLDKRYWEQLAIFHEGNPRRHQLDGCVVSSYELRLNLLTYGQGKLYKKVRIVGIPLSVSEKGYSYETDEGKQTFYKWLKSQRGFTVILNGDQDLATELIGVYTLPTVKLQMDTWRYDDYKKLLRAHYRYRIRKAEKKFEGIRIVQKTEFTQELYELYEGVYERSSYPLEKSTRQYFEKMEAEMVAFYDAKGPIGFCQYCIMNETLYFIFCGIKYEVLEKHDTYYNMLLELIKIGSEHQVKCINFGQTTEDVKQKLGGKLEMRYMYIYHPNPLVRWCVGMLSRMFAYQVPQAQYHVF
ncbi:MAG: hypothetical protein ACRCWY_11190, partial [Cellulosilyticaceae bacterium]